MLDGSKITGNTTTVGQPALNVNNSTFTMKGGAVTKNNTTSTGPLVVGVNIEGTDAVFNMEGGSITENTERGTIIKDVVLYNSPNVPLTLKGNATIGSLTLVYYNGNRSIASIASGWNGTVNQLHLRAYGTDPAYSYWEDKEVLKAATGHTLTAADMAKFPLGTFLSNTFPDQPITNTHKIANSGADIGKLVRTAFSSAPVLTLTPGNGKLTYTWTASVPAADSYDVYWKQGSGLSAADVKTGAKIVGATSGGEITGLTAGTNYSVIVVANKDAFTGISNVVTETPNDASNSNFTTAPLLTPP